MCGIAGYFAEDGLGAEDGERLLTCMMRALRHRGPDGEGLLATPHAGVAATRLAIQDPERGAMPMRLPSRGLSVVHNGEIYDHPEQRARLAARGHAFRTRSDTEVLLHLYAERGVDLSGTLRGMYAFALWDEPNRRLLLARDPFGIKPLFLATSKDGRVRLFASEIKALLASGLVSRRLDPRSVVETFTCSYAMPPHTAFHAVQSLPPGHAEVWTVGEAPQRRRVASPALAPERPGLGHRAAGRELRARLEDAVSTHLRADVEVGCTLSGGLDSSVVAGLAARRVSTPLRSWTMGFEGEDAAFDETAHAARVVDHAGLESRVIRMGPPSAEDYEGTIRAVECPQASTIPFCTYRLARAIREDGVKTVLSGEGADELLAGYDVFRQGRFLRLLGGRGSGGAGLFLRLALARRRPNLLRDTLRRWGRLDAVRERFGLQPPWLDVWWLHAETARSILRPERIANGASLDEEAFLPRAPRPAETPPDSRLHAELRFEQRSRLDGWILMMSDRLGMAHGLEIRVPMLDREVAAYLTQLPPRHLLRGFREKAVLRRAARGVVPQHTIRRRKQGFNAPMARWLFHPSPPEWVRDALSPPALKGDEWLDARGVARAWRDVRDGATPLQRGRAERALSAALSWRVFRRVFRPSF